MKTYRLRFLLNQRGHVIRFHKPGCEGIERDREWAAWAERWPNHCGSCRGSGIGSYYGGGEYEPPEAEPCEDCILPHSGEPSHCPRCALPFPEDDQALNKCDHCGWDAVTPDDDYPPEGDRHGCSCLWADEDRSQEVADVVYDIDSRDTPFDSEGVVFDAPYVIGLDPFPEHERLYQGGREGDEDSGYWPTSYREALVYALMGSDTDGGMRGDGVPQIRVAPITEFMHLLDKDPETCWVGTSHNSPIPYEIQSREELAQDIEVFLWELKNSRHADPDDDEEGWNESQSEMAPFLDTGARDASNKQRIAHIEEMLGRVRGEDFDGSQRHYMNNAEHISDDELRKQGKILEQDSGSQYSPCACGCRTLVRRPCLQCGSDQHSHKDRFSCAAMSDGSRRYPRQPQCFRCKAYGHTQKICPLPAPDYPPAPCAYCGEAGHNARWCPTIPDDFEWPTPEYLEWDAEGEMIYWEDSVTGDLRWKCEQCENWIYLPQGSGYIGRKRFCDDCLKKKHNQQASNYYYRNLEKAAAYKKAYREKNREKINAYKRAYRQKKRENDASVTRDAEFEAVETLEELEWIESNLDPDNDFKTYPMDDSDQARARTSGRERSWFMLLETQFKEKFGRRSFWTAPAQWAFIVAAEIEEAYQQSGRNPWGFLKWDAIKIRLEEVQREISPEQKEYKGRYSAVDVANRYLCQILFLKYPELMLGTARTGQGGRVGKGKRKKPWTNYMDERNIPYSLALKGVLNQQVTAKIRMEKYDVASLWKQKGDLAIGNKTTFLNDMMLLYVAQKGRCAVTGRLFPTNHMEALSGNYQAYVDKWDAPSIDRIDNTVGYQPDNVRLVMMNVQYALNRFPDIAFMEMSQGEISSDKLHTFILPDGDYMNLIVPNENQGRLYLDPDGPYGFTLEGVGSVHEAESADFEAPRRPCPHGRRKSICRECDGGEICEHNRVRSICRDCGGGSFCEHGRLKSQCKDCGGASICEHGRQRASCKECGGSSICEHNERRSRCKECGGRGLCEHNRHRAQCAVCAGTGIRKCGHCRELGHNRTTCPDLHESFHAAEGNDEESPHTRAIAGVSDSVAKFANANDTDDWAYAFGGLVAGFVLLPLVGTLISGWLMSKLKKRNLIPWEKDDAEQG